MTYSEYVKELVNDPHFNTLLEDVKNKLLKEISNTALDESGKREWLYFKIQGVDAIKTEALLASKRKPT